jgi:hypothetical protein
MVNLGWPGRVWEGLLLLPCSCTLAERMGCVGGCFDEYCFRVHIVRRLGWDRFSRRLLAGGFLLYCFSLVSDSTQRICGILLPPLTTVAHIGLTVSPKRSGTRGRTVFAVHTVLDSTSNQSAEHALLSPPLHCKAPITHKPD